jgi:hypothetical protein
MKKIILILLMLAMVSPLAAIERDIAPLDSIKDCTTFISTIDSTKKQIQEIAKSTQEIAKESKNLTKSGKEYSSTLEWIIGIISSFLSLIVLMAGLAKKVTAISEKFNPIYWFNKWTGTHKAKLNGQVGTYEKVFLPEGNIIKIEPIVNK